MKKIIFSIIAILAVMLVLPLCVELFESPAGKEGWYFTMFLAINPVFSGALGLFSGSDVKHLWWTSFATTLCFPLGFWLSIGEIEADIFVYCPIYLSVGLIAMLISHLVAERGQKSNYKENTMKRKNATLYNLFFPVWLLFLHPLLIAAALPVNFGIDLLVVYLALRAMKLENKKDLLKSKVPRTWLFGFAADGIGAVLLLLLSQIPATYDAFGHDLYLNPFRSAPALLIMLAVMALVGTLIYLFNRKFVYRDTDLTEKQQRHVCLALAIATTPYFYLLPTAWFVI